MKSQEQIKKEADEKAIKIIRGAGYEPNKEVPLKVKVITKMEVIPKKRYKDYTGKDPQFFNGRNSTYKKK